MKKGASFGATLVIMVAFAFLGSYVVAKIFTAIEPPGYIVTISIFTFYVLVFEILFRLRPGKFETPSSLFLGLNAKDRIVSLLTAVFFIIVYSVLMEIKYSSPIKTWLIYLGIGLILCSSPVMLFGSKELKQKIFGKKK